MERKSQKIIEWNVYMFSKLQYKVIKIYHYINDLIVLYKIYFNFCQSILKCKKSITISVIEN